MFSEGKPGKLYYYLDYNYGNIHNCSFIKLKNQLDGAILYKGIVIDFDPYFTDIVQIWTIKINFIDYILESDILKEIYNIQDIYE